MARRLTVAFATTVATVLIALAGFAGPASAVTVEEKVAVMSTWTQTSAGSYNAWNAARANPGPWAAYAFDWSTDYCSSSPDNPLGFDFRLPCWRHDFGYRNYKAVGLFPAQQGPRRRRVLRRPEAQVRHVQHLRAAGLLQPGLDVLPGGAHVRLAWPSRRPTSTVPPRLLPDKAAA